LLLHQKRYAEAEPLLVSGCEGLRQHAGEIPDDWKPRASADLQCLAQLYEATGRSDLASEWRKKCQEFDSPSGPQQTLQADGPITSKQ
jgi:eukaryotic-like serine/threonine-protein kinase